ncbi:MAG: DUF2341 domain-containing protein [Crocinitomicaceae bacterium]|nr:DUF2341 domain-containing protein [Flavobacteriales bacterium]NQZ38088.1 DUF2341 domain-containing protein [Crocinitomicaceae bacterium]
MKTIVYLSLMVLLCQTALAQPSGYGFGKQLLIQASQVAGTIALTDFAVLVSFTDTDLRTTANGGNVESDSGFDIMFTQGGCITQLDHQIERYVPATGEYIAWVRIPSLSNSINTNIHMYYGNSSIVVDPSTTNTWSANYFGVYHLNSSVADGCSSGNNLTDNLTSNFGGSIIGEGRDLDNNTNIPSSTAAQHLVTPDGIFAGVTNFTFSGWVFLDRDDTYWERIFDFGQSFSTNFFFTPSTYNGSPAETRARITTGSIGGEEGVIQTNPAANTGSWIYWVVTLDNATTTMNLYKNGVLFGTDPAVTLVPSIMEPSTANYFGRSQYAGDHHIDAKFDEFRLSNTSHSADLVATEYNNQISPATFYTVSAQMTAPDLCSILPIELISFNAVANNNSEVELDWETFSEINNDYFTVERSENTHIWEEVTTVGGAGNSSSVLSYTTKDRSPYYGVSYYRLKQTDFSGQFKYSEVRVVTINSSSSSIAIYPNPAQNEIWIVGDPSELIDLTVYNWLGQNVTSDITRIKNDESSILVNISNLAQGIYTIKTLTAAHKFYKL